MKKILYYCLVDWDWIKQRPQIIAMDLAEQGFEVHVVYVKAYRRNGLNKVDPGKVTLNPIYRIPPLGYRFKLINKLNLWLVRNKVAAEIRKFQPDILWITHPSQLVDIPDTFKGQIVYDCMDDYDVLGKQADSGVQNNRIEQSLCKKSNLIFVSSSVLQKKICSRNPEKADRVHLIRNGCNGKLYPRVAGNHNGKIYAGYVGTIAEWFDFDLIMESLDRIDNLEYFLIGPVAISNPPEHPRIHYIGAVPHDSLYDQIKEMDCMIMPFQLNDIVLAVDPVKLYEYISWQKNIITVDYPEIRRFGMFAQRYTTVDEYCSLLIQMGTQKNASYSEQEASRFLEENSWSSRVRDICHKLQEQ